MSFHTLLEKILKVDQIRNLKNQNLILQEAFDDQLKPLSKECGYDVSNLLLHIRQISRAQQRLVAESSLTEMNSNIKNELVHSIDLYEKLLVNTNTCKDLRQYMIIM